MDGSGGAPGGDAMEFPMRGLPAWLLAVPAGLIVRDLGLVLRGLGDSSVSLSMAAAGIVFYLLLGGACLRLLKYRIIADPRSRQIYRKNIFGTRAVLSFADAAGVAAADNSTKRRKGVFFLIMDRRQPGGDGIPISGVLGQEAAADFAETRARQLKRMLAEEPGR